MYIFRPSDLRRQLDSVVDLKYVGAKTSRKQLLDEDAIGSGFPNSPGSSDSEKSEASTSEEDDEPLSPGEEEDSNAGEWSPSPPTKDAPKDANHESDLPNTIRQRRDEDKRKGKAVSKQLVGPQGAIPLRF